MALPSVSFGHITPTLRFVFTCGHRCVYASKNSCVPKQKMKPYRNGDGFPGFAPRPKYHDSHGTTVATFGTPAASAASAAGFVCSGVEVASRMSTLSEWISSFATCAARVGFDWLSLLITCTL